MIQVRDLYKSFDGFPALQGLNISVPKGAVYGLVGPNGAGKSTAIRHLAGIYRQDSGEVLIDGQPVYENPAVKSRLAYIPDDIFYFTQASILDMMHFYRDVYPGFDEACFHRLGELFQLDPKRLMRKLSKGQQKQAAFWLAVSLRPDVVILDEPVDGLDPVMRRLVWSVLLQDVAERGTTVLVSSHNLRELEDAGQHRQDPAGLRRWRQAAGGAGDPSSKRNRPSAAADPPGQRRGTDGEAVCHLSAVSGSGAADAGRNLYLRAGRCGS